MPLSKATLHDIPALLPLINRAYRGEPSRQGWTTEADLLAGELRTDADDLRALMQRPGALILKYTDAEGAIEGCVYLRVLENGYLYLGMLSVDPARQGAGIGKQLLAAAGEHARAEGLRGVEMQVLSPRAELIAWYERHGYRPTGERRPYQTDPRFGRPMRELDFVVLAKEV